MNCFQFREVVSDLSTTTPQKEHVVIIRSDPKYEVLTVLLKPSCSSRISLEAETLQWKHDSTFNKYLNVGASQSNPGHGHLCIHKCFHGISQVPYFLVIYKCNNTRWQHFNTTSHPLSPWKLNQSVFASL